MAGSRMSMLVAAAALVVLGGVSDGECNRLGCYEVQKYKATSQTQCIYWNNAFQAYNLFTPPNTGQEVLDGFFWSTGHTIPQYTRDPVLSSACGPTCTSPDTYPAEGSGGSAWTQTGTVSQWYCASTPSNPSVPVE